MLVSRVEAVHAFRNRVAHLEPLHSQDLTLVRRSFRQIAHAIDYDAGRLVVDADRTAAIAEELRQLMRRQ